MKFGKNLEKRNRSRNQRGMISAPVCYHKKEGVFKKINITGIPISDIVNFFIDGNNRMWVVMKGYNRCYDIQQEAASGDITLLPQKTNLIYQTSLIYCFNDEQSLYYIDKEFILSIFRPRRMNLLPIWVRKYRNVAKFRPSFIIITAILWAF